MTMRYSERVDASGSAPDGAAGDTSTYSIQSHELQLKIVGITDLDPDSVRVGARHVLLPLNLMASLHAVRPPLCATTTQRPAASHLLNGQRTREESHADPVR